MSGEMIAINTGVHSFKAYLHVLYFTAPQLVN